MFPDSVLASMERDGWTPTQVRALIESYRRLKTGYLQIVIEFDRFRAEVETTALEIAKLQEARTPEDSRLTELLDRVCDTPGLVAAALSASEWHELRDQMREVRVNGACDG